MADYIETTKAEYVKVYKICITFNDDMEVVVDFENFLLNSQHPGIRKYLSIDKFKEFRICDGDLDWNDFDLCFPVADLYSGHIT